MSSKTNNKSFRLSTLWHEWQPVNRPEWKERPRERWLRGNWGEALLQLPVPAWAAFCPLYVPCSLLSPCLQLNVPFYLVSSPLASSSVPPSCLASAHYHQLSVPFYPVPFPPAQWPLLPLYPQLPSLFLACPPPPCSLPFTLLWWCHAISGQTKLQGCLLLLNTHTVHTGNGEFFRDFQGFFKAWDQLDARSWKS